MDPKTQAALDRLLALVTKSENFLRARTEANRPPVRQPMMLKQGGKGATLISELGVEGYLNSLKNRQHNIQPAVRLPPIAQHMQSLPAGAQTTIWDPHRGVAGRPLAPGPIEGPKPTPYAHKGYGRLRPGGPIADPLNLWPASGVPPAHGTAPTGSLPAPTKNVSPQAFAQTDVAGSGYRPAPTQSLAYPQVPRATPTAGGRFGQAMSRLAPFGRLLQRSMPALGLAQKMPTYEGTFGKGGRMVQPASDPITDQVISLLARPGQTLSEVPRAWKEFADSTSQGTGLLLDRLRSLVGSGPLVGTIGQALAPAMGKMDPKLVLRARAARAQADQPTPYSVPPFWPQARGGF